MELITQLLKTKSVTWMLLQLIEVRCSAWAVHSKVVYRSYDMHIEEIAQYRLYSISACLFNKSWRSLAIRMGTYPLYGRLPSVWASCLTYEHLPFVLEPAISMGTCHPYGRLPSVWIPTICMGTMGDGDALAAALMCGLEKAKRWPQHSCVGWRRRSAGRRTQCGVQTATWWPQHSCVAGESWIVL